MSVRDQERVTKTVTMTREQWRVLTASVQAAWDRCYERVGYGGNRRRLARLDAVEKALSEAPETADTTSR